MTDNTNVHLYISPTLHAGILCGVIVIADQLKPEASGTVIALRQMGIRVCMLTGDNRRTANAIAERVCLGPNYFDSHIYQVA